MSYGLRLTADWPRDNTSVTDRALPLFPAVSPIASPSAYTGGTTPLVPSALLAPPPDGEHTHNNNKDPLGTVIITQTASRTRSPVASAHVPAPSSRYVIGALGTGARHCLCHSRQLRIPVVPRHPYRAYPAVRPESITVTHPSLRLCLTRSLQANLGDRTTHHSVSCEPE